MTDTLDQLHEKFKALTPKERNEKLQALFAAKLADLDDVDGLTIDLFEALMKSFGISVKFDELAENEGEMFGSVQIDIRAARDESKTGLGEIPPEDGNNTEPIPE